MTPQPTPAHERKPERGRHEPPAGWPTFSVAARGTGIGSGLPHRKTRCPDLQPYSAIHSRTRHDRAGLCPRSERETRDLRRHHAQRRAQTSLLSDLATRLVSRTIKPMKPFTHQMEIFGPTVLRTRPDTGSSLVSRVAPAFSALKGIFEGSAGVSPASDGVSPSNFSIGWKSVRVRPVKVEICRPIQFHRYAFNYGGSLRGRQRSPGRVANTSLLVQPPRSPKTE